MGGVAAERVSEQRQRLAPDLADGDGRRPPARIGRNVATPSNPASSATQNLAAPDRAVGPVAGAVVRHADHRAARARARPWRQRCGHGGAARATRRPSRGASRVAGGEVLGVQVVGHDSRARRRGSAPCGRRRARRTRGLEVLEVADVRAQVGRSPTPRQKVFFSIAPHASTGRRTLAPRRTARGHVAARPAQHAPARPAITRATESSQRVSMSRSCRRKQSAMAPSRASASSFR